MRMRELDTKEKIEKFLNSGQPWKNITLQGHGLDLSPYTKQLMEQDRFDGCLFLGCVLPDELISKISVAGGIVFPRIPGLPYEPYLRTLYDRESLFAHFDSSNPETYHQMTDQIIYRHFKAAEIEAKTAGESKTAGGDSSLMQTLGSHPVLENLAMKLHDHAITDALEDWLAEKGGKRNVVAIMGGHGIDRDSGDYKQVAHIAYSLSKFGFFMISGGGPGAMEATHLGAFFSGPGYQEKDLDDAILMLAEKPKFSKDDAPQWFTQAFKVIEKFTRGESWKHCLPGDSLGIPTWFYGHEPPTPFAGKIAKYFANSEREEGLLSIALGGVIYAPGSAGTIQEIFQDACQNYYTTFGMASPMVFLNECYWKCEKPVYPLLEKLAAGKEYAQYLAIHDKTEDIVKAITNFRDKPKPV